LSRCEETICTTGSVILFAPDIIKTRQLEDPLSRCELTICTTGSVILLSPGQIYLMRYHPKAVRNL